MSDLQPFGFSVEDDFDATEAGPQRILWRVGQNVLVADILGNLLGNGVDLAQGLGEESRPSRGANNVLDSARGTFGVSRRFVAQQAHRVDHSFFTLQNSHQPLERVVGTTGVINAVRHDDQYALVPFRLLLQVVQRHGDGVVERRAPPGSRYAVARLEDAAGRW